MHCVIICVFNTIIYGKIINVLLKQSCIFVVVFYLDIRCIIAQVLQLFTMKILNMFGKCMCV